MNKHKATGGTMPSAAQSLFITQRLLYRGRLTKGKLEVWFDSLLRYILEITLAAGDQLHRRKINVPTIIIKLDPERLTNPDLDIRYLLPDTIIERSAGVVRDDGYDYSRKSSAMYIYLDTDDVERGLAATLEVIEGERILGNDLRDGAEVGVGELGNYRLVYPAGRDEQLMAE